MRDFYVALGMEVVHDSEHWVAVTDGSLHLSLMNFIKENLITFRGTSVMEVHSSLRSKGVPVVGEPERYSKDQMGSEGTHWRTQDPEGNAVYFDTTAEEEPVAEHVRHLLTDCEMRLARAGISASTFAAFKEELTERYLNQSD
jgi:hypothetical protein